MKILEDAQRGRAFRLIRARPWLAAVILLALIWLEMSTPSRFFEWDEAVFFSQFGNYADIGSDAVSFAASREMGLAYALGAIELLFGSLAQTRIVWAAISLSLVTLAFMLLRRHVPPTAAYISYILFGSSWVVLLYVGSFYASLAGASLSLIFSLLYLQIKRDGRKERWRYGCLLGLVLAASFWFRHIESLIIAVVVMMHWAATAPRVWQRGQFRTALWGLSSFVTLFVIPWMIDSHIRYGSIKDRIEEAQNQGWPTGLVNRAPEYASIFLGESTTYTIGGDVTGLQRIGQAALVLTVGAMAAIFIVGLVGKVRKYHRATGLSAGRETASGSGADRQAILLFGLASMASLAFFLFYASNTQDRYILYGWIFFAIVAGTGINWVMEGEHARCGGRVTACTGILIVWVISNALVLGAYQLTRAYDGYATAGVAATVHTLSGGDACSVYARYGAPQLQIGSGCDGTSFAGGDDVKQLVQSVDAGRKIYVVIPKQQANGLQLPGEWDLHVRQRRHGSAMYIYAKR